MKNIYIFLFLSVIISSCSLLDNEQPNPAYLKIDEVSIFTTEEQGAPTHKITEVWAYADDQLLGVFPLPATIPVILGEDDDTEFRINAGIRNNGEQSRSFIYQPLVAQVFTETISPGETITRNLTFRYKEDLIFDFVEDFENTHIFTLDFDDNPLTNIELTTEDKVSGLRSGKLHLEGENDNWVGATIFEYAGANNAGADSYLEMEYKNDIPFVVGAVFKSGNVETRQPLIILNEKDDWNKIYIDFTFVLSDPTIDSYRVFMSTDLESYNKTTGTIYFDNLKFVHL